MVISRATMPGPLVEVLRLAIAGQRLALDRDRSSFAGRARWPPPAGRRRSRASRASGVTQTWSIRTIRSAPRSATMYPTTTSSMWASQTSAPEQRSRHRAPTADARRATALPRAGRRAPRAPRSRATRAGESPTRRRVDTAAPSDRSCRSVAQLVDLAEDRATMAIGQLVLLDRVTFLRRQRGQLGTTCAAGRWS